jgi:HPt (histidine-containing phosphotransfer) domain-containing protein
VIEQLREMERSGSPGFLAELGTLFVKQGEEQMAVLAARLRSRDEDGLCRSAHLMKGSSGSIGAMLLMGLCRELEEAARGKSWSGAEGLVARVTAEFARVREALRAEGALGP